MTTHELRKIIQVISFHSHSDGCNIKYTINGEVKSIIYNNISLHKELALIGSIDDDIEMEEWADYNISQWDALTLVIRYEYEQSVIKDVNESDIFKSIANIIKPAK